MSAKTVFELIDEMIKKIEKDIENTKEVLFNIVKPELERIKEVLKYLEPVIVEMGHVQENIKHRLTRLEREKVYK